MKLYLFGGAEVPLGQAQLLKNSIKETILSLHPTQVLHIPFSRLHPTEEDWKEGWFKETMKDTGIEILDARNEADLERADNPLIFINGGSGRYDLLHGVKDNKKILDLILHAEYIVTESAGGMLLGEFQHGPKGENTIVEGLGILKSTIIEPHYTQRNLQQRLIDEMKETHAKYGIGIDSVTAIVVDPAEFPQKWSKIGSGTVVVKIAE